jgi:hypothetical protein
VNIEIQARGTATWTVFTTAFRKVAGGTSFITGNGVIQWNLEDGEGKPAASGLYYLRVETKADQQTSTRILKILVLR